MRAPLSRSCVVWSKEAGANGSLVRGSPIARSSAQSAKKSLLTRNHETTSRRPETPHTAGPGPVVTAPGEGGQPAPPGGGRAPSTPPAGHIPRPSGLPGEQVGAARSEAGRPVTEVREGGEAAAGQPEKPISAPWRIRSHNWYLILKG